MLKPPGSPAGGAGLIAAPLTDVTSRASPSPIAPISHVLTAVVAVTALLFIASIAFAMLTEAQSDYLGARSEASGGFDPTVFPPFDTLTWLMALVAPLALGLLLALTIAARVLSSGRSIRLPV